MTRQLEMSDSVLIQNEPQNFHFGCLQNCLRQLFKKIYWKKEERRAATSGCAPLCAAMIWFIWAKSGNIGLCSLVCGNDLVHLGKLLLQSGNVALRPDVVGNESLLPEKILSLFLLLLPSALRHTISPFLSFSLLGIGFNDNLSLFDSFWEAPWGRFNYCVPRSLPEWIVGGVFDLRYLGIDGVLFKVVSVFIAGRDCRRLIEDNTEAPPQTW